MKLLRSAWILLAVVVLGLPGVAQEKSVRPGINKSFENPNVKEYVEKFEGESREIAKHAKEIIQACGLKPGMAVADVGAGTGFFTRQFAAEVGPKGKVYAVDIASSFLRHIEKTCEERGLKNVQTIQCDQFSTKLPPGSVDLVFICDVYHHFEFPQRSMQSVYDALRAGGKLVLIDFERIEGKSSEFILGHVRAGKEVFVREVSEAGFRPVSEEKFLKENYLVRFEKVVKCLFDNLPSDLPQELIETLVGAPGIRIERIVSHGHASPVGFWYDQEQSEWVVLLQGAARLRLENELVELKPGDYLNIPAHLQHRVEWTSPDEATVWLTVHY